MLKSGEATQRWCQTNGLASRSIARSTLTFAVSKGRVRSLVDGMAPREADEEADEVDEPGTGPQSSGDQLDMFPDHDPRRKPGGLKPMRKFSSSPKHDARTGTG